MCLRCLVLVKFYCVSFLNEGPRFQTYDSAQTSQNGELMYGLPDRKNEVVTRIVLAKVKV